MVGEWCQAVYCQSKNLPADLILMTFSRDTKNSPLPLTQAFFFHKICVWIRHPGQWCSGLIHSYFWWKTCAKGANLYLFFYIPWNWWSHKNQVKWFKFMCIFSSSVWGCKPIFLNKFGQDFLTIATIGFNFHTYI